MAQRSRTETNNQHTRQCRIRIRGHLESQWSSWFDDLEVRTCTDGTTLLSGQVVDDSALHGLLKKVRDLGLPLLSVDCSEEENLQEEKRMTKRKVPSHLILTGIYLLLVVLTMIPSPAASKECLLGYKALCSFSPIGSVILLGNGIFHFILHRSRLKRA